MSRIPPAFALLQLSNAVNRVLRPSSGENWLEFGTSRSDRCWELILDESCCMLPGSPSDIESVLGRWRY